MTQAVADPRPFAEIVQTLARRQKESRIILRPKPGR
jgi:hypothetical protein